MSDVGNVRDADLRFFDALRRADADALGELLAEDFVIVDVAAGGVTAREPFVDAVRDRAITFTRIDVSDDALVRSAGTAAVIVGRTSMAGVLPDGAEISVASRYTHVFVPAPTGWRLLSAQGTVIS